VDRQLWSNHLELDHKLGPNWDSFECPLCLELTEPGKSATLVHFARHMEDIALAALPREVESEDGTDEERSINSSVKSLNSLVQPDDDKASHEDQYLSDETKRRLHMARLNKL